MIKVLFLIDQLLRGGAERLLLDLLPKLPHYGIEPSLCVLGQELRMLQDFRDAGLEPLLLQADKWNPMILTKLSALIRSRNIDLVNAHLGKSLVFGWLASRRTGVPLVTHDHIGPMWPHFGGSLAQRMQNQMMCHATEWCMQKANAVIAVSEPSRQWLIQRHAGLTDKVTTITNGIDVELLQKVRAASDQHRQNVRQEFGIPESSAVILYAASFRPVKRWDVFVDVAERLCQTDSHVHFIGGGEGPMHHDMLTRVNQAGLGSRVHLPGSRNDVPRLMASADIFLMPTDMESDGIVAKEAMAMGMPIVASDIPMLSDKIQHGESGFLMPGGDVPGIVDVCQRLLANPVLRASCGKAALSFALQHFDIETCAEKTQQVYREVVGKSASE